MRLVPLRLLVSLAFLAGLSACGGDDDNDGNGNGNGTLVCDYTPCGGDPVGSWKYGETCSDEDDIMGLDEYPECADAVFTGTADGSGTLTFKADGTYAELSEVAGSFNYEIPEECALALSEGAMGAEAYCGFLEMMMPLMGGTADCSFANDLCKCDVELDMTIEETGTWLVDGVNVVTTDDEFDIEASEPFCVDGNTMMMGEPGNEAYSLTR